MQHDKYSITACLVLLVAPIFPAGAATIGGTVKTYYDLKIGAPGSPVDDSDTNRYTTDHIISGPMKQETTDFVTVPLSSSAYWGVSSANSVADFGSHISVNAVEAESGYFVSGGEIEVLITREDFSLTSIPYTISHMDWAIDDRSEAFVGFTIAVYDPEEIEPLTGAYPAPVSIVDMLFRQTWDGLNVLGTHFDDFAPHLKFIDDFTGTLPDANGGYQTYDNMKAGYFEETTFYFDIADLDLGKEYLLNYSWLTAVDGYLGFANFQDPLDLSTPGGLDQTVMAALTSTSVPAVPLPAAGWCLAFAVALLGAGKHLGRDSSQS